MKIAISASGRNLDSMMDPRMGRCDYFLLVDSDTMEFQVIQNGAVNASGGAGIQAAQTLLDNKAEVVITGNVGPNAWDILAAAGVKVYRSSPSTVEKALKAWKAGELESIKQAGPAHGGLQARHGWK